MRIEYWQQVKQVDPENLIFIDEMGVLLGLTRTQARSLQGSRVYDFKPFYRGSKVTVIGAISLKQVLAPATLNGSMNVDKTRPKLIQAEKNIMKIEPTHLKSLWRNVC